MWISTISRPLMTTGMPSGTNGAAVRPQVEPGADPSWVSPTPGERMMIRVRSVDVGGAYTVIESIAEPMCGPPLHIHEAEDEVFHILEGTLRFRLGDRDLDAPAGTTVTAPRGVPHTWWNFMDHPARMVVIFTPGGIEGLFDILDTTMPADLERAFARFNVILAGPTLGSR